MKIKPIALKVHIAMVIFLFISYHQNEFTIMLWLRIMDHSAYLSYSIFKSIVVTFINYDCVLNKVKQYFN